MKKSTVYSISAYWEYDQIFFNCRTIRRARQVVKRLRAKGWKVAVWREVRTRSIFKTERIWR